MRSHTLEPQNSDNSMFVAKCKDNKWPPPQFGQQTKNVDPWTLMGSLK